MVEYSFNNTDIERYGRWIDRIAGVDHAIAICDAGGAPLWINGNERAGRLSEILSANAPGAIAWSRDTTAMQRHEIDARHVLLYVALQAANGSDLGGIVVLADHFDRDAAPIALDHIEEALQDVAAALRDEHYAQMERLGLAEELSERYEELHLVYALDARARKADVTSELFENVTRMCAEQMAVDVAAFIYPETKLTAFTAVPSKPIHNLDLVIVEMRGDLFRFVSTSGASLVLNDKNDLKRPYVFTDMPYKVLAVPVTSGSDRIVAMLVLLNHESKANFTNSDRKLAEIMANQLSSLLVIYDLLREQRTFVEQMAAALIETVEAKDPYTRGHSERVHHITMEIGRALGLPADDLENLFWGSLLHDVGKIGIPDAVLCKPARLTADEYTFIMVHPERSYEILRHIDRLKGALPGARHHQEKYDGTGYPHRLKGDEIPLHGRIIAVADTYDSITSSRAYRAGRSHEEAVREMKRVSGTQLDPAILDTFLKLCEAEPSWMGTFSIRREEKSG
ncbi:MAG: HD-GYP domain-containing protein [Gammaproteobacteria bacterium]|nr:HD-GYP domain-containing protein [Gammaproteobacteria bacterium]MDH3411086.1 HD-GYP domain-containing protein [Gammaproteobacteria bacterium]